MAVAKKTNKTQPPAAVQNFPIVGIGASAGGLDAFKRLLAAIPENSGMAYVLVQHLDPTHESILPEILQRATKIPVHEITDEIHLAPDHIYIIPSNKILTSTDGVLQLTPREKKILNFSIDIFFTSIADVHKEFAVGIVLSGTGSDGTLGLKAIKDHGGISFAQDSESATYNSMPQSAVNAGVVDFILAPEKIPAQLLQINRTYKTSHFYKDEDDLPKDDEGIFKQILLLLRQRSGVDFTYYKQPTFHRRIARRIAIVKKKNLADYLKFLRSDKAEQDALFQDVLIPVTSFFRDQKTYKALTDTVFPALFKNKTTGEPIRVWIAACSTGEEAFSIAICLHEFLGDKLSNTKIQIFATDISEKAIKKARAAIYTMADVEKLSASQLKNYFVKNNGGYEVGKLIRDMCVFAPHNFLKDPPFAKMDLITCRNVLIYMDTFLQKKAFSTFHYALKENGFLLLGKSETTGTSSDLFNQVEKHEKIYSRKPLPGRFMHVATERKEEFFVTKDKTATKQEGMQADFRKSAEAIMIAKSPASVVVNEAMDIVYIHGDITPFLQAPQGKPTYNLLKMAREGLAFELRNALHKAKKEQAAVTKEKILVKANDKQSLVTIEVIPLTDTIELHNLIRFEKIIIPVVQEEKKSVSGKIIETQKQNEQLEKELSQTREDMRSITEDMEATNEELQSANEELQSSNEEMQSLNEELETSKEELQSTNEELTIVNQELLDKQEQLNESYAAQMKASKLIEASEKRFSNLILQAPVLINTIIGPSFIVETINKTALDIWGKSYEEVINKPLFDSSPEIEGSLKKILKDVYTSGETFIANEIPIQLKRPGKPDTAYFNNVYQPLRDINNKIYGIIVVGTEVTEAVIARKLIEANTLLINSIYMNAPASICTFKGPKHIYELVNPAYQKLFDKRDLVGKSLLVALPELKGQGVDKILDNVYNTGEIFTSTEIPVMIAKADNSEPEQRYYNTTMQPIYNEEHKIIGVVNFGYDVTEQIMARKQIEESEKRFSNILSQSIMSIAILKGADLIIAFANEKMMASWGKGNNIIGKPLLEVLYELKGQPFPNVMQQVFTNGVPYYGYEEKAILMINGKEEVTYYNYVCQPYTEVDNTISGVTILANEVTEQVLAKKQTEASEKRFSNILSQSLMAICILKGRELVITSANDSILEMWGKGKNVIGKKLIKVLPEIKDQAFLKLIDDVYTTGVPFATPEIKATLNRKGTLVECYFNLVYQPYRDVDDSVTGITVFATEITQQVLAQKQIEKSESKFRILSETIPNMIWAATPDGNKNFFNKYFLDYTGLSLEELKDDGMRKIIFPADLKNDLELWNHSLKTGEDFNMEKRIRHHDGTYRWHLTYGIAQKDIHGNITGWIGSSTEIENQKIFTASLEAKVKERTAALQILNEELNQTNSQLEQFAYVASHDLQEPLRKIVTFSMVLQDKHKVGLTPEAKIYLNKIESSSKRMRTLIDDLLNYSRLLQHEKLFWPINLTETLKNILTDFELLSQEKKAKIKFDELPTIEAIPLQMNQLFYNLISNALKFSKLDVPPIISITSRILTATEIKKYPAFIHFMSYVEIIVKDNGIGFEQQYAEKIFTIFQRLHSKEAFIGTGIGLALAKKIIENHHGEIFVNANENEGAAFHIILPIKQPQ